MDVGDSLREHIADRLASSVDKYFDRALEGEVHMSKRGASFRADISVHAGRGLTVQGHAEAGDAYSAFNDAADRIAKRLRRYKRRLKDHRADAVAKGQRFVIEPEPEVAEDVADDASDQTSAVGDDQGQPIIVAEMDSHILSLSVREAVMHLDLTDQTALMFRNAASGRLNTVYRRDDGNIGWIDPQIDV